MKHSPVAFDGVVDPRWRIGIVHSSFYEEEIASMVDAARRTLVASGIPHENITVAQVAGSFEVPLIGSVLAKEKHVDALIGLGIVVEGQTHHARLLAEEAARGIMDVQLTYGIPFAFEILYVHTLVDARARAVGDDNKGVEAAYATLHSLHALNRIRSSAVG